MKFFYLLWGYIRLYKLYAHSMCDVRGTWDGLEPWRTAFGVPERSHAGGPGSGLMRCLENVETPWRFYPLVNIQKTIEHGEIVDLAIAWWFSIVLGMFTRGFTAILLGQCEINGELKLNGGFVGKNHRDRGARTRRRKRCQEDPGNCGSLASGMIGYPLVN